VAIVGIGRNELADDCLTALLGQPLTNGGAIAGS
jgi:hypothetical protein